MKSLKLTLSAIAASTMIFGLTAFAATEQAITYKVIAYNNCEVVTEFTLNQAQSDALKALNEHENSLDIHQLPMKEMERKLAHYAAELEALSTNIVTEENGVVKVNQQALLKQAELTRAMEDTLAVHEIDISGIEANAAEIEKRAQQLDNLIAPQLAGFDYDQVVIKSANKPENQVCHASK